MLSPGDQIYHPKHGFGTITGLQRLDPRHPIQEVTVDEDGLDKAQDYYDIQLMDGGTLLVPVDRAAGAGLRLLTNSLDAVLLCLQSPPQSLPDDARKRAAELWARGQAIEPTALAASVRDMVVQSRGRSLTTTERTWLDKSCARLSTEVALVDHISRAQAHAAISNAVKQLSAA